MKWYVFGELAAPPDALLCTVMWLSHFRVLCSMSRSQVVETAGSRGLSGCHTLFARSCPNRDSFSSVSSSSRIRDFLTGSNVESVEFKLHNLRARSHGVPSQPH